MLTMPKKKLTTPKLLKKKFPTTVTQTKEFIFLASANVTLKTSIHEWGELADFWFWG